MEKQEITKVQEFLRKDYHEINTILSNGNVFAAVQNEEKTICQAIENLSRAVEQQKKQQENVIGRKYDAKINVISMLVSKLQSVSHSAGQLTKDDLGKLEKALAEMMQILETQKKHEMKENDDLADDKGNVMKEDYRNRMMPVLEQHYDAAKKRIDMATDRMEVLEQFYETASFDAPIWKSLKYNSTFPMLNSIRMGEKVVSISAANKETVSYSIPEIVPFYGKNSLVISYKNNERHLLKQVVDNIFLRSLMAAKAGNVLFYFMDGIGNGDLFFDFLNIGDESSEIYNGKIFVSLQEIENILINLQRKCVEINQKQRKDLSIEAYNALYPKTPIPYRIVFVDSYPNGLSVSAMTLINRLASDEINSGLHFVLLVKEEDVYKAINLPNATLYAIPSGYNGDRANMSTLIKPVLEQTDKNFNLASSPVFSEYFDKQDALWTKQCNNVTEVALGETKNGTNFDLRFVENGSATQLSLAHMLIGGSSGCGKSFLLHEFITGLSLNYSPAQIRFFLIDLKGTEFKQYEVQKLPHAEFIAMNGDAKFGLHVLRQVLKKMDERRAYFRKRGADVGLEINGLEKFRKKFPDEIMPRYFIIIDEYQNMFIDPNVSYEAKEKFETVAREGRALGFNLILASQTIEVCEAVFNQMGIKVAMRCDYATGRKLLGMSSDNKTDNLKVGQAYVNCGSNESTFVKSYFLPTEDRVRYLQTIHEKWINSDRAGCEHRMLVFDTDAVALMDNNLALKGLLCQKKPKKLYFSPGEKLMVDYNDLICEMSRDRGNNILFVGGKLEASLRAINGCLMSMMPQFNDENVKIDIFSFVNRSLEKLYHPLEVSSQIILGKCPKSTYSTDRDSFDAFLDDVMDDISKRKQDLDSESAYYTPRLVVVYQAENCDSLHKQKTDLNGFITIEDSDTCKKFKTVLEEGPKVGVHCLIHYLDADGYNSEMKDDDLKLYNYRVLLQMSEENSRMMMRSKDASCLSDKSVENTANRAIYYDAFLPNDFEIIKPYEFYV